VGHRRADGQASQHARVVGHVKVAISWAHCHARRPCTDRDAVNDLTGHRAYHRDAVAVHDVDLGTIWAHRHVCGRLADLNGRADRPARQIDTQHSGGTARVVGQHMSHRASWA
jgi:hypothetical protein